MNHLYPIYKKGESKGSPFARSHDHWSVRITVDRGSCYLANCALGRFKHLTMKDIERSVNKNNKMKKSNLSKFLVLLTVITAITSGYFIGVHKCKQDIVEHLPLSIPRKIRIRTYETVKNLNADSIIKPFFESFEYREVNVNLSGVLLPGKYTGLVRFKSELGTSQWYAIDAFALDLSTFIDTSKIEVIDGYIP